MVYGSTAVCQILKLIIDNGLPLENICWKSMFYIHILFKKTVFLDDYKACTIGTALHALHSACLYFILLILLHFFFNLTVHKNYFKYVYTVYALVSTSSAWRHTYSPHYVAKDNSGY